VSSPYFNLRLPAELRRQVESVLRPGESMAAFFLSAAKEEVRKRETVPAGDPVALLRDFEALGNRLSEILHGKGVEM